MLLKLGTDVLELEVELQYNSTQSFGLEVSEPDGVTPADLTGSVATLEFEDGVLVLTAVTDADVWQWNIDDSESLWTWSSQAVTLVVTAAGERRVWGRGVAEVVRA